jgi:hypothetical protein
MEPAVIAATPSVDTTMVEPDMEDTTSVDWMMTVLVESVEHRRLTAVTVDAVRIDETVALFERSVDPDKDE